MAKKTEEERDLTAYLDKKPTDLQERFAEWLMDEDIVGYDPAKAKTKEEAFREGVRLATAMRMVFQASPENQEANAARRTKAEVAEEAPVKSSKKKAAVPAKKAKRSAEPEEVEDEAEAPAPKKTAKKASKAVGKRRAAAEDDEAPF